MVYNNIMEGIFLSRPNRFIAEINIGGNIAPCHVKNTGRCKELLAPGAKVLVNKSLNPNRATKYDLISVWKGRRLINMDSQAPNIIFGEFLRDGKFIDGLNFIKPEAKYNNSRFDFYIEAGKRKAFIEVKGVTLEENNVAIFPDAPTERGIKHLNELAACLLEGYEAYVVFIIQMEGIGYFIPNNRTHAEFGRTLKTSASAGVTALAYDCIVTENSLLVNKSIPIKLL
ncbi:MAG: DNA/RNA nuclease SfsA [Clostridiales bacterium]|nr:DNA/RNA nuclease SfsA [Clostridiales bacterium]